MTDREKLQAAKRRVTKVISDACKDVDKALSDTAVLAVALNDSLTVQLAGLPAEPHYRPSAERFPELWAAFHRLWGRAKLNDVNYDKAAWMELEKLILASQGSRP